MRKSWNLYSLLGAVLLVALAGCDPSQPVAARQAEKPQATAPPLPAPAVPAAAAPQVPPPLTRDQQRVRLLIQQAEQAYAFGQADYSKGN
jgi:hypothetical protein